MTNPYLAEIRLFGFNFAPRGWAFCNGQIIPIQQNTALFSLLGTNYGGNGSSNFGLPNLQEMVAIGAGNGPSLDPILIPSPSASRRAQTALRCSRRKCRSTPTCCTGKRRRGSPPTSRPIREAPAICLPMTTMLATRF